MSVSFINQFKKLQKLMLEDQSPGASFRNSQQPQNLINSVHLMKQLIAPEIAQKKNLGIYPRRRLIDQRFREKVKQNSDINAINSKVISKNYHLRTKGDNDRALGIELLVEEVFRRKTVLTQKNINMVTFIGENKAVKMTKHAQIIKLLVELEQIGDLKHLASPQRKGEIVRLPITLKYVNELISRRNVNDGHCFSMNHNFVNMFQNGSGETEYNMNFSLNQGKIRQKRPTQNGGEVNFFNLNKGPLLQNTDRVDIQTSNGIVKNKRPGYTNFIQSFVQDQLVEESIPNFQREVFGARLDDSDIGIDDLFSFSKLANGGRMEEEKHSDRPKVTLMNAFKHQGEEFQRDPFSFKPEVPENYKPFEFGCMADRQTTRNEPIVTEVAENGDNFKKRSGVSMGRTRAGTGLNFAPEGSGSILGSKIFNFTGSNGGSTSLFGRTRMEEQTLENGFFNDLENSKDRLMLTKLGGATPQTRTSSIYQMLAEEYSSENQGQTIQNLTLEAPKYWEDLDMTTSNFLAYNMQKIPYQEKFEPLNIISEKRNKQLCDKIERSMENLFEMENEMVTLQFIRKNLDLVLMGIPGDLFILDQDTDEIKLCNGDKTLDYVSKRCLNNLLQQFEQPSTQIHKLYKLAKHLRQDPLENSFTNKTLHTILDEYLDYINQVVLDIPKDFTLLQYLHELKSLFSELDLIFEIFYRPTLLRTTTSQEMELEALKNVRTSPDQPFTQGSKDSIDTENLNMLYHLLCSLQRSSPNVALINYIFKQCMVPILSSLRLICFKGQSIEEMEKKLKIKTTKDQDFNYIFQNVPHILDKCISDVIYCAQNISMLKSSDDELFRIMMGKSSTLSDGEELLRLQMDPNFNSSKEGIQLSDDISGILELIVDPKNVPVYQRRVNDRFRRIEGRIRDLFLKRKMKSDERKLNVLKEKLTKLKKMKLQVEMQKETKYRMRELEKFKRTQLNNILQAQVIESQARKALRRNMEIEFEKSLLLDNELRAKQAERDKIIQEIRDLGTGFDQEIEQMLEQLEERRIKQREALEAEQRDAEEKKIAEAQERSPDNFISPKNKPRLVTNKDLAKTIKLIDDGQGYDVDFEELKNDNERMKQQVNDILHSSQIKNLEFQSRRKKSRSNKKSKGQMEEEDAQSADDEASRIEEMIQNPFEVKEEDREFEVQELAKDLFMESKTKNLISLQTLPPPLTVMFHSTVTQNIRAQAELTNRLILKIMFEKYDLVSIMGHFKKVFLGERGDCSEAFVDLMYGKGVTIGPGEIRTRSFIGLGNFFNSWKYQKNDEMDWELKFSFKIKKNIQWEDLEHVSIISTNINELVTTKCKLPPPISFLMSDQVLQLYFRIMCFACKFRLHGRILNNLWKHIHIDIQDADLGIPKQICRNLMFIRHNAQNFANKFLDYLYHLVIETGFNRMLENFISAKTFNHLFKYQAKFLNFVTRWGFMKKTDATYQNLMEWMELIVRLNMICRRITIGYDNDTDFKQLNEQIKELAAKLTMIQDSFGNLLDKMMQRIKLNSNKSFKV